MFAGHDVVLRCQSDVTGVTVELLRDGKFVPYRILRVLNNYSDLGLHSVGPQHTGNYTCRYTSWLPEPVQSEPSNPVELLVEGMASGVVVVGFCLLIFPGLCIPVNCAI